MDKKQSVRLASLIGRQILFTLVGLVFLLIGHSAQAAAGQISVTAATSETLTANLAGAVVQVLCADGAYTTLGTTDAGGLIAAADAPVASNCDVEGESLDYTITKDGYVTKTVTGGTFTLLAQNDLAITDVQYTYKITAITSETVGTDLLPTATLSVGDATGQTACTRSGAAFYCPVVAANCDAAPTAAIAKDGYVTKTDYAFATGGTARAAATEAQTGGTITSVQYAYKVTGITAEATLASILTSVTALSLGDVTGKTACVLSGSIWYCPIALANSETLASFKADVVIDGYVQPAAYSTVTGATARSSATDAQVAAVTIAGIQYALKVTVTNSDDAAALSGATVTAGTDYATSCAEAGVTGVYYCAVPLASTATSARSIKSAWSTVSGTYTDRTLVTSAQSTIALASTPVIPGGGGGGNQTPPPASCTEVWICNTWSACTNSQQVRTCTDTNACGTTTNRPALTQSCVAGEVIEPPVTVNNTNFKVTGARLIAKEGVTDATVYYIGSDGKKYAFPDAKTYFTWFPDFKNVEKVSSATLDLYPDGGIMTYRNGTKLVTHINTAKVYAVEPNGVLRHIPSEEIAVSLFGSNWHTMVQDVIPGYFSTSYTIGSNLSDKLPSGTIVKQASDYYYIDNGIKRKFASTSIFVANGFDAINALLVTDLSKYSDGTAISTSEF